jgi:hypothetical protein
MLTTECWIAAIYVIDGAVRLPDFVPIYALEDAFVQEGDLMAKPVNETRR